jgi:hypothetical protein
LPPVLQFIITTKHMSSNQNLQRALHEGYEFNLGQYFSRGFDILNKNLGVFIVGTLIFVVGIFIISIPLGLVQPFITKAFEGQAFVGNLINSLLSNVVQPLLAAPLGIGFANAAHKANSGKEAEIGDLFAGFQKYTPLAIVGVLVGLLSTLASLPGLLYFQSAGFDPAMFQGQDPEFFQDFDWGQFGNTLFVGGLISAAGVLIVSTLYGFAQHMAFFYDLKPTEALAASQKLVSHNLGSNIGLWIVIFLLLFAGMLACCIGVLYAIPATMILQYVAFASMTGLMQDRKNNDDLTDHFTPQL